MKVINANEIKVEKLREANPTTAEEALKEFIKIDAEFVQYVKAEEEEGLLKCSIHPFVQAVHLAYSDHLPLVISPDMIWYLISSGFAAHINKNAEELRHQFVDHEGKKTINIRRDDFSLGSKSNPWHEVVDQFCAEIVKLTNNEIADTFVADFSTTSKDARVVSQIVLMDAMQQYFEFRFSTLCGIPEIRLLGEKKDWESVKNKAEKIFDLIPDLCFWKVHLDEILEHFINAFDDNIDNEFWNQIYKVRGGSGGPYVTGWIIAFFPYLKQGSPNRYVSEKNSWKNISEENCFAGLTTSSFDYHMNQVPFTWQYFCEEIKMLFVGGLISVAHNPNDSSVKPVFGYAVTENKCDTGSE